MWLFVLIGPRIGQREGQVSHLYIRRLCSVHNPSRSSRGNNLQLKLGLWKVSSVGRKDKLLSIQGDATARRLHVSVLKETRHSEKVNLKLDGGHTP